MSDEIVRGDLLTVRAAPKDVDGNDVEPLSVVLYLNYKHEDGETSTDNITMLLDDGQYVASWDSKVALPGILQGSIRTVEPPAAYDFRRKIIANDANPTPDV